MNGRRWRNLQAFAETLERIDARSFSKYQRLLAYLQSAESGWTVNDQADRLVVFSERLETLRWLHAQFKRDLHLRDQQITIMHGQLSDTEQQDIVERFGRLEDPLRVLLCSDVASEGLNLHYFCHRLVHFDLPWSLMVFQQRNGRVDRYGQATGTADPLSVHRHAGGENPRRPAHPGDPATEG